MSNRVRRPEKVQIGGCETPGLGYTRIGWFWRAKAPRDQGVWADEPTHGTGPAKGTVMVRVGRWPRPGGRRMTGGLRSFADCSAAKA